MLKLVICVLCWLLGGSLYSLGQAAPRPVAPRLRVIVDNDFSGDPDGLFQLAHLLLSPSVEVRGIIGSHLKVGDGFDPSATQADNAARKAREVMALLKMTGRVPVLAGANLGMRNDSTPIKSAGVDFIIKEALRTDTQLPLYVLCGAGLTEIASAALTDPRIASRLTLVWIGGPEYPGRALPPPHGTPLEYNLGIDIAAARAVFNRTRLPLWQVPRNAYRQALLPYSQLLTKVRPRGKIGAYLSSSVESLMAGCHSTTLTSARLTSWAIARWCCSRPCNRRLRLTLLPANTPWSWRPASMGKARMSLTPTGGPFGCINAWILGCYSTTFLPSWSC